jgi:hypothetical protein
MGICLLCGFLTPDLDVLDEHVSHVGHWTLRRARSRWSTYGWCPRCGANQGQPCRTFPGDYITEPHADRERAEDLAA